MPINTTPEKTLELLRQAVEERGADFVYPTEWKTAQTPDVPPTLCMYVRDNQPACIAGYVFYAYGIPLDELESCEGSGAYSIANDLGFDERSVEMIQAAQSAQDRGDSWGTALQKVQEYYDTLVVRV